MTPAEKVLPKLDKVRRISANRWTACCSAHKDKNPSLAITETKDSTILIHCFAGCNTADILDSIGLSLSDLFPARTGHHKPRQRRPFDPRDVLNLMQFEATLAALAASKMSRGEMLSSADKERLITAAARLSDAAKVARHG